MGQNNRITANINAHDSCGSLLVSLALHAGVYAGSYTHSVLNCIGYGLLVFAVSDSSTAQSIPLRKEHP